MMCQSPGSATEPHPCSPGTATIRLRQPFSRGGSSVQGNGLGLVCPSPVHGRSRNDIRSRNNVRNLENSLNCLWSSPSEYGGTETSSGEQKPGGRGRRQQEDDRPLHQKTGPIFLRQA